MTRTQNRLLYTFISCLVVLAMLGQPSVVAADEIEATHYDMVVYGGTSAGVVAAVQAKRMGKSVILVCPDRHLGGLSAGGLGWTDTGNKAVIGGLAREFYHRIWQHYQDPAAWKWQPQATYGNRGQGNSAVDGKQRTQWISEPHVAEKVFETLIAEHEIPVRRDQWLDRELGVHKQGARIESITLLSGHRYTARVFIDASYEGDLMAAAGVEYHVGRESEQTYGEDWNGVRKNVFQHGNHFGNLQEQVSPYVIPGDASSGLLPRISPKPPGEQGAGDQNPSLLFSDLPYQSSREPPAVYQATSVRCVPIRTYGLHLSGRLA